MLLRYILLHHPAAIVLAECSASVMKRITQQNLTRRIHGHAAASLPDKHSAWRQRRGSDADMRHYTARLPSCGSLI